MTDLGSFPAIRQRLFVLLQGDGLRAQLLRGGIGSIVVQVCGILLSLALAIVLARTLGPEGYGTYAFVLALVTLLTIPAQFGLPVLVIRETAKAQANEEWGKMRGVWRWTSSIAGLLSLMLAAIFGVIAWLFADRFTDVQLATFVFGLILVPLTALGNLRGAALQGLRNVVQGKLPEIILRPGFLLIFVMATVLVVSNDSMTADRAMALHALAAAVAFAIGAWLLWRSRPAAVKEKPAPVYLGKRWLASTLPLAFIAGMQLINQQTDILMLGVFTSAESVGIYRVASQGAVLVSFGLTAIGMVMWPHFARLHEQGNMVSFQKVATMGARAMFVLALPIALTFIVFGEWLLEFVFGGAYTGAYYSLVILAVANVVHAAFGTVGPLLNMTGHERTTARAISIAAICNVVLNLLLIPPFGIVGAALATSLTLVIWNFVLWYAVRQVLGVDSSVFNLPPRFHS